MAQRVVRSALFVPGHRDRMLEKARSLPADAFILDLEDAVPMREKANARVRVGEVVESGGFDGPVCVRINGMGTPHGPADLDSVVRAGLWAICVPKAERPEDIAHLDALLTRLEGARGLVPGGLELLLLVETPLGILNAFHLAQASERVSFLCLGGEDLTFCLGAVRTRQGLEIAFARGHLVMAARAAGVMALDTVFTDLDDPEGLLADARHARELGFSGKLVIHPSQIEPVHRAFRPTEEETAQARRIVEAVGAARGDGGAFSLDGKMIDGPIVARAREVLAHLREG